MSTSVLIIIVYFSIICIFSDTFTKIHIYIYIYLILKRYVKSLYKVVRIVYYLLYFLSLHTLKIVLNITYILKKYFEILLTIIFNP